MYVWAALRQLRRRVRRRRGGLLAAVSHGERAVLLQAVRRGGGGRAGGLHAVARHAVDPAGRGGGAGVGRAVRAGGRQAGGCRGFLQGGRLARPAVRELRHHVDAALAERATGTQVVVQRLRDPVQEGREARRRGCGAGAAAGQRGRLRVRLRATAAAADAVGMLRPGWRGEVGVFRNVRRRRHGGGRRILPLVAAQHDALLAGVHRPGAAEPVPVLLVRVLVTLISFVKQRDRHNVVVVVVLHDQHACCKYGS